MIALNESWQCMACSFTKGRCSEVLGREGIIESLTAQALAGNAVLLYGPRGVGKSAILREVMRVASASGVPCGTAVRTDALRDVTSALLQAYPRVVPQAQSQRRLRSSLRLAVERSPGVVVLDHLQAAGTALKGFLRSLHGTGLGVLMAADVEHPGDHARFRAMRLAYQEQRVPPLNERQMRRILQTRLARRPWSHQVTESDRSLLLEIAAGRPGVVAMLVERLDDGARYWSGGRILCGLLRGDVSIAIVRSYVREANARDQRLER